MAKWFRIKQDSPSPLHSEGGRIYRAGERFSSNIDWGKHHPAKFEVCDPPEAAGDDGDNAAGDDGDNAAGDPPSGVGDDVTGDFPAAVPHGLTILKHGKKYTAYDGSGVAQDGGTSLTKAAMTGWLLS